MQIMHVIGALLITKSHFSVNSRKIYFTTKLAIYITLLIIKIFHSCINLILRKENKLIEIQCRCVSFIFRSYIYTEEAYDSILVKNRVWEGQFSGAVSYNRSRSRILPIVRESGREGKRVERFVPFLSTRRSEIGDSGGTEGKCR